ncbi:MAG: 23S rRNA (uracil(1939)-C(5))-methyltransferase RlmD [Candidatus Berkelbacteria bacterium]
MKLTIEKLVFEGKGLSRSNNGQVIFTKKSVPGDELEITPVNEKKSFSDGKIDKIVTASPFRIKPKCPHFEVCGGCDHQNIALKDQLRFKDDIFHEVLSRAKVETKILPIIAGSETEFGYRNTMRFFLTLNKEGKLTLAMHDATDYRRLIEIDHCDLISEKANLVLNSLVDFLNENVENTSSFSQIKIREGINTDSVMLELFTSSEFLPSKDKIIDFVGTLPDIKSFYHSTIRNDNIDQARRKLLGGSAIIFEKTGKYTFQISPESFFQTNSFAMENLYDVIKEMAEIKMGESVLDLFCGAGTIGIYLSTFAKKTTGIDIVQSAINDASANAKINKVINCEFICDSADHFLLRNKAEYDKIIVDPPRTGLTSYAVEMISKMKFRKLIYISCNPATFARDVKLFETFGLKLKKVQPVDMFPQTYHIECVGVIEKI